jgi:hypothetical protein
MRIVKIEKFKSETRSVYDISETDLMKFGGEHIVRMKLQSEDSTVIDWLEDDMEEEAEDVEKEDLVRYETEWVHEDDEI